MEFLLSTREQPDIRGMQELPAAISKYQLQGAEPICASGDFGNLIFQHIPGKNYQIWQSNYLILQDISIQGRAEGSSLELHFCIQNDFSYDLEVLARV